MPTPADSDSRLAPPKIPEPSPAPGAGASAQRSEDQSNRRSFRRKASSVRTEARLRTAVRVAKIASQLNEKTVMRVEADEGLLSVGKKSLLGCSRQFHKTRSGKHPAERGGTLQGASFQQQLFGGHPTLLPVCIPCDLQGEARTRLSIRLAPKQQKGRLQGAGSFPAHG